MTTTSSMPVPHGGQELGAGLDDRLLNRGAQFARACARSVARAVQALARRHRKQRDMRQLMSMSEHRLRDIGLSRAEIGSAVLFYVHR
ncbi:MAG TPA: DUF1127 domain-containing protein [Geminicoccaceae bacterium]|nr:DUF1127 domain-containing protein [Geminicoccaceae bacterium]